MKFKLVWEEDTVVTMEKTIEADSKDLAMDKLQDVLEKATVDQLERMKVDENRDINIISIDEV